MESGLPASSDDETVVSDTVPRMRFAHFTFDPAQDLLGEGPLAEVYRARDEKLGRTVALKILRPHVDLDPEADRRFEREARHTSHLAHTNIATIFEYGEDSGRRYIAMEYLQGRTLDKIVKDAQLGLDEALRIAVQLTSALALVHREGLIHRDLKPANVMVQHDGTIKLLDFGIARANGEPTITQHGMLVGTVLYMSPEQVRGDELDARADIFSLGAMLYHALTGQLPFPGNSFPEVCMAILDGVPKPLNQVRSGLPKELDDFVMKCLATDPAERYADATQAHGLLNAIVDGLAARRGIQASSHLSGNLAFAPLETSGEDRIRGVAASLRKDIASALQRSGLVITLLESQEPSIDAGADYLVRGNLAIQGPRGSLDLELSPWGKGAPPESLTSHLDISDEDEWVLQDSLVRAAVRSLRRQIQEISMRPTTDVQKRDPEAARRLARRGHQVLHKGMTKHLLSSISLFRRALEEDPLCPLGYAGLGEALARKFLYWDGDGSFLEEGRGQARRAIAIDPTCAEAHTSIGFAHHLSGAIEDARREYRLAIQIDNDEWFAHRLLGAIMLREGNFKGASPLLTRAIAIRPDYISSYDHLHNVLQRLDRYEEAIEAADRGIGIARALLEKVPDDQDSRVHLAILLARMGMRDDSLAEVGRALEIGRKDGFTNFHVAIVHAVLGNLDEAMASLTMSQSRGFYIRSEARNAEFDILRGLPDFQALIQ